MAKQIGTLTVVAKTAGLKMMIEGVETNWINPTKEAKTDALQRLEELRKYVNKKVQLEVNDEGYWSSLTVMHPDGEQPTIEEENLQDNAAQSKTAPGIEKSKPAPKPPSVEEVMKSKPTPIKDESDQIKKASELQDEHRLDRIKDDIHNLEEEQAYEKNYFEELRRIEGETKNIPGRGGNLTYISWAEAWQKLKEQYPDANYIVHENNNGMPYFYDQTGGFVKVSVTVARITHTVHLPVMDHSNRSIPPLSMTTMDINKTIMRALTKAIAMHGMGLYVYKGEDYPASEEKQQ